MIDFKNPFENRNPEEVWKELRAKAKPVNKEEFLKRMAEQAEKNKKK